MGRNQRIEAHQHRRRIIMHYGHSFTLTRILQFVKFSCESRWEMKRHLLAGRLLKSPLGCTCSQWVEIKVEGWKFLKWGPQAANSLYSAVPAPASPSSRSSTGLNFLLKVPKGSRGLLKALFYGFQIGSIHFCLFSKNKLINLEVAVLAPQLIPGSDLEQPPPLKDIILN